MQPILLDLGFWQIRYYGLFYAIALLLGLWLVGKEFKRKNIPNDKDQSQIFVLQTFLFGILGARLYYVLFSYSRYFNEQTPWWEFLAVWHGGLAIHGGVIFGCLGFWLYGRKNKIPFLVLADIVVLPVILGQAIGRLGNLMNGDAHGIPTDLPWGLVFSYGPAAAQFPGQALHPVMLYESLLNLSAFALLWFLRTKNFRPGFLASIYLLLYAAIRSYVTQFRADDLYLWGIDNTGSVRFFFNQLPDLEYGIRAPHAISLVGVCVALFVLFYYKAYQRKK